MDILQAAEIIIGSLAGLGVLIAGAGYGYGQFYKGRIEVTKDDIDLFNQQLDTLKKICTAQQQEINELHNDIKKHTGEIGRLQGINEEKDKKIKNLEAQLDGRDPALAEYIKFGREAIMEFKEAFKRIDAKLK